MRVSRPVSLLLFFLPLFLMGCFHRQTVYFKEIPEVTAITKPPHPQVVLVKVHLGYEVGNKILQQALSRSKPLLADRIRFFFATRTLRDLRASQEKLLKERLLFLLQRTLFEREGAALNPRLRRKLTLTDMAFNQLEYSPWELS